MSESLKTEKTSVMANVDKIHGQLEAAIAKIR